MTTRPAELQALIDATEAAIAARADTLPSVRPLAAKIFDALRGSDGDASGNAPARVPVCVALADAVGIARRGPKPVPALADAFEAVEPRLTWAPKGGSETFPGDFFNRHANAVLIGDGGIEYSDDVRIGTSLVAANTHYPRHQHAPEELYVVLSPGEWMKNDQPMQARASGDLVHNEPNVWHAMQAGDVPLLAIWCLWTRDA